MNKSISVKGRSLGQASVFMAVFLLFGWMATGQAQENKVDLNALIQETQRMSQKADEMALAWWIPEEFWQVSFARNPNMTMAQAEEFMKVLRPYTVIVVMDGKAGALGGITYKSEAAIRAGIQIKDSEGTRYRPLSEDKIDADSKNFLSIMKPVFVNMLGPLGQNMNFFLFPAENKKGQKIAEAKKEGSFSVEMGEREFKWRLPLGSLLPPKICPTCGEKLSGAYKFCPWDGASLSELKK
ncbi:MAG: hypothetical protein AB1711_05215 [Thermodesulfobacteriota bacterium]